MTPAKIAFLTFLILFVYGTAAVGVEISFRANATVAGEQIRLGDIAEFNEDTVMAKALSSLILGPSPEPGQALLMNSQAVQQYLQANHPIPDDTVWQGASAVAIKREAQQIKPQYLLDLIQDYLARNAENLPPAKIRFIPDSLPLPFYLPSGTVTPEIIPSNPNILGSSRFSIIMRIDSDVVKNMSVRGRIEALADVVTAATKLERGTVLTAKDISLTQADIANISRPGFSVEDMVGLKLTRSLRAGTVIVDKMVETLPIVYRGQKVKILVRSGSLEISATGLANSDGRLDDMIHVQNIQSNKVVICRVTAPGIVEVLL